MFFLVTLLQSAYSANIDNDQCYPSPAVLKILMNRTWDLYSNGLPSTKFIFFKLIQIESLLTRYD
jgi:hypothetical protein